MFIHIFVIVILLSILCYNGILVGSNSWQTDVLSKKKEVPTRGFLTLLIVVHHVVQQMNAPGILALFNEVGLLCVACFFFFSGYGLMYNTDNNEDYLKPNYFYKYIALLIPFYLTNICYLIYQWLTGRHFSIKEVIKYTFGFDLINSHAWYIITIAIFYCAFYCFFRYIRNRHVATGAMFGFLLLYTLICLSRGSGSKWFQGEWWFNSCILFGIGILFCRYQKIILRICKKLYFVLFPLAATLFVWFWTRSIVVLDKISYLSADSNIFSPKLKESYICLFWQMCAVISFVFFVFLVTLKFRVNNKLLRFISSISLELYLIHGIFVQLFHSKACMIKNDILYLVLVIVCSIATAWLIHYPVTYADKGIRYLIKKIPYHF